MKDSNPNSNTLWVAAKDTWKTHMQFKQYLGQVLKTEQKCMP